MKQIQFDMKFVVDGKKTICGFKSIEDENGPCILLCATIGDYTQEYELRRDGDDETFHFVTPDVPEDLIKAEPEISEAILEHLEE